MKYSVLILAQNEEAFIGNCLQSIMYAADKVPEIGQVYILLKRQNLTS